MNVRQRESVFRSRAYLDLAYAPGKTCLRCGDPGCEPCHYQGLFADQLGRGGARKALDLTADLCRKCHEYFDRYDGGNTDARAAEFLLLILRTLARNLALGLVRLEVGLRLRQSEARDATTAGATRGETLTRRRASSAVRRSRKTGHANGRSTERPLKSQIGIASFKPR